MKEAHICSSTHRLCTSFGAWQLSSKESASRLVFLRIYSNLTEDTSELLLLFRSLLADYLQCKWCDCQYAGPVANSVIL
jgi:hypothetical protein